MAPGRWRCVPSSVWGDSGKAKAGRRTPASSSPRLSRAPKGLRASTCKRPGRSWIPARPGRRRGAYREGLPRPQLFDPRHHVAVIRVHAVEVDENLVGGLLVAHREVGAAEVVEQAEGVLLVDAGSVEAAAIPADGQ